MDSGVMSPGFGGIIWSRVVRGAGGSTKACAVAATKHSRRRSMVVRHFFWWFLATSLLVALDDLELTNEVKSAQSAGRGKELAEAACFSEERWSPELAEISSAPTEDVSAPIL